ncbi:integrase core domain-containing protein, partial [Marinobacterium sp. xm-d-420]|uniref:integrase core domain-containing protein n=1 Tax=Marinobacterium sp. xm-d-420 TaxID=2497737 RepID=UPI001568287F
WFRTLDEARYEIDLWRDHYNKVRPHSALGYVPPEEFAKRAAYQNLIEEVVLTKGKGHIV